MHKPTKLSIILFTLLVANVCILYFYKLNDIPPGFYVDEAAPAYNAYSILETGKDEYGKSFPIVFRFFEVFAPPIFTYISVIPTYLFGLEKISVRLVSSLSGILSILLFFLLIKKAKITKSINLILLGVLMYAITPWLVFHSRIGYEIVLGYLLFIFGAYLLYSSLKNINYLLASSVLLTLSTYAAYTYRLLVPVLLLLFFVVYRRKLLNSENKKIIIYSLLLSIIVFLPYLYILNTPAFFTKGDHIAKEIIFDHKLKIDRFLPVLSLPLAFAREFLSQYFNYFSPRSLFFIPDPDPQRSLPGISVFYLWQIIPLVIGIYSLYKKRKGDFYKFIILLMLVSPIPSAIAKDPFATHRAMPFLLPVSFTLFLGVVEIYKNISSKVFWIMFTAFYLVSFALLYRSLFILLPHERSSYWDYGYEQLAKITEENRDKVFIIDTSRKNVSYIQLAFYLEYPPAEFQKEVNRNGTLSYYRDFGKSIDRTFSNIRTRGIVWEYDIYEELILVGDMLAISEQQVSEHYLKKMFEIKDKSGETIFVGYQTDPETKCINTSFSDKMCYKHKNLPPDY
jgi:4-amino-4-deoxy-L-arabinose transferase-like glycosyltransferase